MAKRTAGFESYECMWIPSEKLEPVFYINGFPTKGPVLDQ